MAETETKELYNGDVKIDFYPKSHRYKLIELDGEERNQWLKSPSRIVGMKDKSGPLIWWAVNCFHEKVVEEMRDGNNFTRDDVMAMLELGKKAHTERRDKAADVGSVIHKYAQHHADMGGVEDVKGFDDVIDFADLTEKDQKKARSGQEAFDDWYKTTRAETVKSEFLVYSKKHNYVGRADELADIDGDLYLLDFKTSKGIYPTQLYQVTAYMKAYEEEYPDKKVAGAMLVSLIKEDILDKDDNVVREAGSYKVVEMSRSDLVSAYVVFKALKEIADRDPVFTKMLKEK